LFTCSRKGGLDFSVDFICGFQVDRDVASTERPLHAAWRRYNNPLTCGLNFGVSLRFSAQLRDLVPQLLLPRLLATTEIAAEGNAQEDYNNDDRNGDVDKLHR